MYNWFLMENGWDVKTRKGEMCGEVIWNRFKTVLRQVALTQEANRFKNHFKPPPKVGYGNPVKPVLSGFHASSGASTRE